MFDPSTSYRPNALEVAHETFDSEVVLIHFPSGRYFRLDAVGRAAWAAIERGASVEGVADELAGRFRGSAPEIHAASRTFLEALHAHQLIVPADGASVAGGDSPAPDPAPAPAALPFSPPRLEVFSDLEDLLLLDPIHDVDETGWPRAKP